MSSELPLEAVRFFSSASPVHTARLFEHEGSLYRAISPEHQAFFRGLFEKNIIQPLIEQGLVVETEIAAFQLKGYPLVLRHNRVPFVTYASEWAAPALKDAGLLQAKLNVELASHGLCCVDAHPWNILFDGTAPRFIDIGSIAPLERADQVSVRREFDARYIYPLRLMAQGQRRLARWTLRDFTPLHFDEVKFLLPRHRGLVEKIGRRVGNIARGVGSRRANANDRARALWEERWRKVDAVTFPQKKSMWSGYYAEFPRFDDQTKWKPKHLAIANALQTLNPKTLVDIGANTGWYSQLAASRGVRAAACDIDEPCLDRLYLGAKERKLPVNTVHMNIRFPLGGHGWGGTRFPSVMDRLKSDCVLALAILHHLVYFNFADFDLIVNALCQFTRKDLIIEFISKEDKFVSQWWNHSYSWYTLDNLLTHLRRKFHKTEILPSNVKDRSIVVCTGLKS